eukprot:scaffold7653_cov120-Isochrysis_galbana.AAC.6
MPRLPSALGLSGAKRCGGLVWTDIGTPLSAPTPLTPYPPIALPPPDPCTRGSYRPERRRDGLRALPQSFQ